MATAKKNDTTRVVEDAVTTAQEQILGAVEQGQTLVLEGYKTMLDAISKLDMPAVPGLGDVYKVRADMFEGMFGFGAALLENQRTFTRKVLETASKAQS
ncbi:MAG: hypothetical protein KJO36_11470 [Acidimicrobiia bacterium]|nr:hypothetical protein [Acidimicrobiia bacterium]NNL47778.1 hypothetical protein [Acidimicrobiia bacterium]